MAEKIIRTFKYRIYPTKAQAQTLTDHLGLCCELYNAALQERRDAWKMERRSICRFDQIRQIPAIRKDRRDVGAINSKVLEDALTRVDKAFAAFFSRIKNGSVPGYPRFRIVPSL